MRKNTRDYGKKHSRFFAEGGAVEGLVEEIRSKNASPQQPEWDPNAASRAGSQQYGANTKGFWGRRDPYSRQEEVSPPDSEDRNRLDPQDMHNDKKYRRI
jgi:hypothetical protein